MSAPGPTPARPRSRAKTCLFGCLATLIVAAVLAVGGCVGFMIWVSREGEVSDQTVLLTGGEEVFGSLYLTPDNEALIELMSDVIERNQRMQNKMGGIGRFLPKQDPDRASREQLEELLPMRIEGALYPASAQDGYEHLVKAEISYQYRVYGLMFRSAAFLINATTQDDPSIRVESLGGITTIVARPDPEGPEQGFAFVGNTLYWASPPTRIAGASELSEEDPAHFAPPDARVPVILEDVGGEANPIWMLLTGASLEGLAFGLGEEPDEAAKALGALLSRSETLALGASLDDANTFGLRLAGVTETGRPIDAEVRGLLSEPLALTTEAGLQLALDCEERGVERWSCEGSLRGFRDAFFTMMDEVERELDAQNTR